MARNLTTGLQRGLRQGLRPGLGGGDLFTTAALDLNFARYKTLDPRITFTRASSGTFVGSDGLIKAATTNLLTFSEDQSNAAWLKIGATISSNSVAAPTGSITADTLVEDTSTGTHRSVASTTILSSTIYSVSIFAKAAGRTHLRLNAGSGLAGEVIANLSNGTVASSSGATNPVVQAVGNGWYRISFTTAASTSTTGQVTAQLVQGTSTTSYTGDGTSGIYLWGAQLEQSSTVGEYIPTTSTINSAPRFDHNPTTGESLGLMVEEQRTNSIRNNTIVGAAAGTPGTLPTNWIGPALSGLTREVVGTGTESGIAYVDVRYFGTTTSALFQSLGFEVTNQIAATQNSIWTSTAFVKLVGGSLANITATRLVIDNYNSSNVALGQYAIANFVPTTAALGTQRYSVSSTSSTFSNAATAFVRPYLQFEANSGAAIDITLRVGLPQLEQGAFATSVIPTSTAAATRSADVASITGANFSSWYNQTEGTVFCNYQTASNPTNNFASQISDNSYSNRVVIGQDAGNVIGQVIVSNSLTLQPTSAPARSNNAMRQAFGFALNSAQLSLNGTLAVEDTSGAMTTALTRLDLGSDHGGFNRLNGTIRRLTYFPIRLPNATLQQITR